MTEPKIRRTTAGRIAFEKAFDKAISEERPLTHADIAREMEERFPGQREWEPVDPRPKHFGGPGRLIPGSQCPECGSPMEYDGNYWCSECEWILPEDSTNAEKMAFNLAYVLLMQMDGRKPDLDALDMVKL